MLYLNGFVPIYKGLQDSGLGNITGTCQMQRYTTEFRALGSLVERKVDGRYIKEYSFSALWWAQLVHETLLHPISQRDLARDDG